MCVNFRAVIECKLITTLLKKESFNHFAKSGYSSLEISFLDIIFLKTFTMNIILVKTINVNLLNDVYV